MDVRIEYHHHHQKPWFIPHVSLILNKFLMRMWYMLAILLAYGNTTMIDWSLFYISKSPFTNALWPWLSAVVALCIENCLNVYHLGKFQGQVSPGNSDHSKIPKKVCMSLF